MDVRGAAVEEAIILLRNTCDAFQARSGRVGTFQVGRVSPAEYVVQIKGPGFLHVIPVNFGRARTQALKALDTGPRFRSYSYRWSIVATADRNDKI